MVRKGFPTILSAASIGLLFIFSVSNSFLVLSYEVTDQSNEGVFSSLSRNFDKTLEEINSDDKSQSSNDQDTPSNTANPDDDLLQNSTLAAESQNSTGIADLQDIELQTPLI